MSGAIIVFAALAAYHNSFSGPFILDDPLVITGNPSIRHWGNALSPPAGSSAGGRPVLNLTFALNYMLGGMNVWGYHAVNLLVHILAGLTLFGCVHRTLLRPAVAGLPPSPRLRQTGLRAGPAPLNFEKDATSLALAVAVIWVVHPIQTEAVTYISQRAESLMGLFYLLTLYCFIRSQESGARSQEKRSGFRDLASGFWLLGSICSCLLGTMSKENIVTAPVMVLLYDRTFVAGSFREAWRRHWRYYLGLAGTWLLLARLMTNLGQRSVGFGQGVTWWNYALTSCRSVVLYLKLAAWPHPLVFDYGNHIAQHATEVVPYALVLVSLLAAVALALRHWPAMGFLGAWFFVILAPTSSVVPVALQPMAEHRLYLSLAAIVALGVLGLYRLVGSRGLLACALAAVGLGGLSVQRNQDYKSELNIWSDTVAKAPDNARAHNNLGKVLLDGPGRLSDAIAQCEAALRIDPNYAEAHNNLGVALSQIPGHSSEAIAHFQAALRINPGYADAHNDLGVVLSRIPGRLAEAVAQYEAALQLEPDSVEAHSNLGKALLYMPGRLSDAIAQFQAALRIAPDSADTHNNLGYALSQIPARWPDAVAQYEVALRINPDSAQAHYNLGNALLNMPGRLPDAVAQYEAVLRLKPDSAEAHSNLGKALLGMPGRLTDAIAQFQAALRIDPDHVNAHSGLGAAFVQEGHLAEALAQFTETVRITPEAAEAHNNLGVVMLRLGRLPEAIEQCELALRFNPDYKNARANLELARKTMAQQAKTR